MSARVRSWRRTACSTCTQCGHLPREGPSQISVHRVAGTGGQGHVAVSGDRRCGDAAPLGPAVRAARREASLGSRTGVDVVRVRQHRQQAEHGGPRGCGGRYCGVVSDEAGELRKALTTARGRALHWPSQAPGTALPHPAVAVYHEVVGQIGPALLSAGVVPIKGPKLAHYLARPVIVRTLGMMHEQESNVAGVLGLQLAFSRQPSAPIRTGSTGAQPARPAPPAGAGASRHTADNPVHPANAHPTLRTAVAAALALLTRRQSQRAGVVKSNPSGTPNRLLYTGAL